MVVDWPVNLQATVGPTVEQPSEKLLRGLTQLEPGEEWLIEPKQLDDSGRLWRPGTVSYTHLDVYKRQATSRTRTTPCPPTSAGPRPWARRSAAASGTPPWP